jgi:chemotaxis protein methyltransferase CheR
LTGNEPTQLTISDEDFALLYPYIHEKYGINLRQKKQLINSRLARVLEEHNFSSFHDYVQAVISGRDQELASETLDRLTTNYTSFMREREHFAYLQDKVLPELERRHRKDHVLSIWSAACSTGEEPYTISMYLMEYFDRLPGNWDVRILASDLSEEVLASAQHPVYDKEAIACFPEAWQRRYFTPVSDSEVTITKKLRNNVIFRQFNLMETPHFLLPFDVIFCRNVMIYFDQQTKEALIRRLFNVTVPEGYLFIGHSEGVNREDGPYVSVAPAILQKRAKK